MTSEDLVAAKLKGYNCILKFKDGEEVLLIVPNIDKDWFQEVEDFIHEPTGNFFPLAGIAVSANEIKYVKEI